MNILKNHSLSKLNSFAVEAYASAFYTITDRESLKSDWPEIAKFERRLVLGGGSNLLFAGNFSGLVLYPQLFGIELIREDENGAFFRVGASENWHQFVSQMTKAGYYGLENLALIPGTVGAAPVQNIGAYGVEVKSLITWVEVFDLQTGELLRFSNQDCEFGYRDSLFKRAGQGRYLVLSVEFQLSKEPILNLSYQPLADAFSNSNGEVSPMSVMEQVIEIRQSKLPDPSKLPNAGSFFKNPVVEQEFYLSLKTRFPKLVAFPAGDKYKLAAGWLIDNAGLKGERVGDVGTHLHQALVIVNYGERNGAKVWAFAESIREKVKATYGVELEAEVRVEGLDD